MKKLISVALAVALLLGCLILPTAASAEGIYSTSYSIEYIMGYSWSTGNSTGSTQGYRVFFKNPAMRAITKYRISIAFYDSDNTLLDTNSSSWITSEVPSDLGAWSPIVRSSIYADHFKWKLSYYLENSSKVYNTKWLSVAEPEYNEDLLDRMNKVGVDHSNLSDNSTSSLMRSTSMQERYLFNINSKTGAITGTQRYLRNYFKNIGCSAIVKYSLQVTSKDSYGYTLSVDSTGNKKINLKRNKGMWTAWVEVPMETSTWSFSTNFTYRP